MGLYLFSSQLVVTDPFRHPGWQHQGIINQVKTGEWSFFTKREPGPFGNIVVNLVLMHAEAAVAMKQFDGNLLSLTDVYGTGFKPEGFDVTVDRRLVGFFDFGAYVTERERRLTNDYLMSVLRTDEEAVVFKGAYSTDAKTRFPAGLLVNTMHDPRAASVSTLRDEDGQAVAVFIPFGRDPQ